jgi:molybdate transport system substrate-binding protein
VKVAAAFATLAVVLVGGGCGADGDGTLTVFAASSLRDVLPAFDKDSRYVFAGSDTLAAQIRDGADADVFLSASPSAMERLVDGGLVDRPVVFASNALVVVTPSDRDGIGSLDDLAGPGVRLVLGGDGVPVGDYARHALETAGLTDALANVVSNESSVSGVLAKVALGEADAGIVYTTDVKAAGDAAEGVVIPPELNVVAAYPIAVTKEAGNVETAQAFVAFVAGPAGQTILAGFGFAQP